MRIGIDCRLPAYQMGGISQYVLHLVPALAKLDKTNEYVLFHSRKETRNFVPAFSSNFHHATAYTPCHHRFERWAMGVETLPHRLDLLHSPDFIPPAFGAKKYVATVHDLNFFYYPDYLTAESKRYYHDQIAWAVAQADHISADSHQTRQDLIEKLNVSPDKVTTVHLAANPIYQNPITPEAKATTLAEYGLPEGFVLFVGTLEPRKNVPALIRTYKQLRDEYKVDVPLVLVGGKGWLYDQIFATIAELNLTNYVKHLQGVPNEKLAHLYAAAGVLAQPSHYEGFGLPHLEAMHCGCPVVSSDRGSLPEVVGNAGILLPPDNTTAWANAIHTILTDSQHRQALIAKGYPQANSFTWERTARQTLEIYDKVASGAAT